MSHVPTTFFGSLSFLRKVLFADAAISAACGALMALGGTPLQGLLGLPAGVLVPAGPSLFVYAAFVGVAGAPPGHPPRRGCGPPWSSTSCGPPTAWPWPSARGSRPPGSGRRSCWCRW